MIDTENIQALRQTHAGRAYMRDHIEYSGHLAAAISEEIWISAKGTPLTIYVDGSVYADNSVWRSLAAFLKAKGSVSLEGIGYA